LQSLRRVLLSSGAKYPEEFLKAHGRKLIELDLPYSALANLTVKIFDLCPSLNSISLSMGWPNVRHNTSGPNVNFKNAHRN
jgi:hypothetical protein